jgi:hypothetical protein
MDVVRIATLPLRLGLSVAEGAWRLVAGLLPGDEDAESFATSVRPSSVRPSEPRPTAPEPVEPVAESEPESAPEPEPAHVEVETELVAESADAGAADGAGAELRVEPPWDGYEELTARDVVDRLAIASPAVLAVVELYERAHRDRRTVIAAVERRLRETSPART